MRALEPCPTRAAAILHDRVPPDLATAWDELADRAGSPFASHAWLSAWCEAFGPDRVAALALHGPGGTLRGAVCLVRGPVRGLVSATNDLSGGWDAVAVDDAARRELWKQVGDLPAARLELVGLPPASLLSARKALTNRGYRLVVRRHMESPWLALPASADELLASVSRKLRSQTRQFRRRLEGEGRLALRTVHGPEHDGDLERFLELEASGWKGERGTAIRSDPRSVRLYRGFARAAAERGWLRLHLLELDGTPVAGDLSCVVGGGEHLLKTAFDERHARLSPGLVLRAEVLGAAIAEGLSFYDFLGGPDHYKMRWATELRERLVVHAYRGVPGAGAYAYQHMLRPAARRLRGIAG
jgi:CelD/BcsL family acetyltransferase involved in cellulose biosynthesis